MESIRIPTSPQRQATWAEQPRRQRPSTQPGRGSSARPTCLTPMYVVYQAGSGSDGSTGTDKRRRASRASSGTPYKPSSEALSAPDGRIGYGKWGPSPPITRPHEYPAYGASKEESHRLAVELPCTTTHPAWNFVAGGAPGAGLSDAEMARGHPCEARDLDESRLVSLRVAALEAVNTAAAANRALIPKTISGTHRIAERRVPLINLKGHHGDYPAFV